MAKLKLAIIGLDTSHSVALPNLLQGNAPRKIAGMKAVTCLRFASPFYTEEGQDGRQADLEGMGIKVTRSFADAVRDVDGIMLEINDPAQHWKYFRKAAEVGKPIFIDKPFAGSLADARKIVALAKKKRLRVWSASSLRFDTAMADAAKSAGDPLICQVYGAMGIAAAGSSLLWYGCHEFEMLEQVMGCGAVSVMAVEDAKGIVTIVDYGKKGRGLIESNTKNYSYGGRVQGSQGSFPFTVDSSNLYFGLMQRMRQFFVKGETPVALKSSFEVQAIIDAAERSLRSGKREKVRG